MGNIPNAEQSPRIVNGVIYWYENDTFSLNIELDFADQDDTPVDVQPTDIVTVVFTDRSLNKIKEFVFTDIVDNNITLDFNSETTRLFPKGHYTYDVIFKSAERTTVANDNKVVVE